MNVARESDTEKYTATKAGLRKKKIDKQVQLKGKLMGK